MIRTSLAAQSEHIARRKTELGIQGRVPVARNPGGRRTASKRALLERIAEAAAARGAEPPFDADIR